MGSPNASLQELCFLASEFDMDFIELRGIAGTLDLPDYLAANPILNGAAGIRPPVRLVATDLRLIEADSGDIDRFLRFVDVATLFGAPYVRVFGGGAWGDVLSKSQLQLAARTLDRCRAGMEKKSASCDIIIETHSGFSSSSACLRLNELLREPLCILWDSHHTWRNAGEAPAETWRMIGPLVRHIHFSDSRLKLKPETGHEFVLPGSGEYPIGALSDLLADVRYSHGVSLEWEKLWHPKLPELRVALKEFQRVVVGANA